MENSNPKLKAEIGPAKEIHLKNGKLEDINVDTVFELIRNIIDPEHPYSLEKLNVVNKEDIEIGKIDCKDTVCKKGMPIDFIDVIFTPTVPHCSMAGMIGLSLKAQLERYIEKFWIRIYIKEGTHTNYKILNKQFNDKDRVMAALENDAIIDTLISQLPVFN